MKIVRLQDLSGAHPVPAHHEMKSLDYHGMEKEGNFHNILILSLSQFLPGGGADRGEIKADVIYYVLEGEMTVITDDEEQTLRPGDTVRFEKQEVRELVNRGNMAAKMLVIAGIPSA